VIEKSRQRNNALAFREEAAVASHREADATSSEDESYGRTKVGTDECEEGGRKVRTDETEEQNEKDHECHDDGPRY
jgi:uncharacterized membrane protein